MVIYSATRFYILKVFIAVCELQLFILIANAQQQPELWWHSCPNTTTYGQNSTYQANLRRVLSDLSSNKLFFNATVGDNAPDVVYGLVLCRGDITSDACRECVKIATTEIIKNCPNEKEAYIWYDQCMLRYNNISFFDRMDTNPGIYVFSTQNVSNPDRFDQVLGDAMDVLINRASGTGTFSPVKGFATGQANITSILKLFNLVQCTPNLSTSQCNQCLRSLFNNRVYGSPSWRIISPSCIIRYETYLFYNNSVASPTPPPSLAPPPSASPKLTPSPTAPEPLFHFCPDTTTYNHSSTYQANLHSLLSDLSSDKGANRLFVNASAGNNAPDVVYGMVLCRGDVNMDACRECVQFASTEIRKRCPKEKESYIWYDQCMLRYNNKSFFGSLATFPIHQMQNRNNFSDPDRDNQALKTSIDVIINLALGTVSFGPLKYFATGEYTYNSSSKMYNLVQCSPDLSDKNCEQCLRTALEQRRFEKQGGGVLLPNCNIRHELYPFYNSIVASSAPRISTTPPPPPPHPPLPPVPPPPAEVPHSGSGGLPAAAVVIIVVLVTISIILFTICFYFKKKQANTKHHMNMEGTGGNEISEADSLQYDLRFIKVVTNNFCADNKIGEGGFGEVFKGSLDNGQHIAVKRLSKTSGQGEEEFKNEVTVVAKLQHRNLVRLLGYCLDKEEKILIYEFVPNKSLDFMLFDLEKQQSLNWSIRYNIIGGLARGILYLHEDSPLRIIHRDIKASNVLLDKNMNAKISDFGLARIVGFDESEGSTDRVVGTFGYMSLEYIMHGQFSIKFDVFSFGVLVLEIISGKRNNKFYQSSEHLLSHAWQLRKDGKSLDLLDPGLEDCYNKSEVTRCIHMGLLCVQKDLDDRPTMASVLLMLNSSSMTLPIPHRPAFFVQDKLMGVSTLPDPVLWSANGLSISELYPR